MKALAALALVGFLPGWCPAQEAPAILVPRKVQAPVPARYVSVAPAPDNERHFVARTRHLLELVRKHPAPDGDLEFRINGLILQS